jgi:hypothetical protein
MDLSQISEYFIRLSANPLISFFLNVKKFPKLEHAKEDFFRTAEKQFDGVNLPSTFLC